ncbi:MAG: hypothetical protein LBU05_03095, partial [Bifidobacteriaceae bacterium]|nr:hypothetical protein [Bifidobacteriaceae bacterium]
MMALQFVNTTVAARVLGPAGRGYAASMLAILMMATVVFGGGVAPAVRRQVAAGRDPRTTVGNGRFLALCSIPLAVVVGFGLSVSLFAEAGRSAQVALIAAMGATALSISWAIDASVLVTRKSWARLAVMNVIMGVAPTVIIIAAAAADRLTVSVMVWSNLAGNALTCAAAMTWVRAPLTAVRGLSLVAREALTLVGALVAEMASRRLDQVFALILAGPAVAGYYSVAVSVAMASSPLAQAVGDGRYNNLVFG